MKYYFRKSKNFSFESPPKAFLNLPTIWSQLFLKGNETRLLGS